VTVDKVIAKIVRLTCFWPTLYYWQSQCISSFMDLSL